MTAGELFEEIGKLNVVELEQRLKQLLGEVAVTRKLLTLAKARQRGARKKTDKKTQPALAG